MIITINQKIAVKEILSKHGVNANKLITDINSNCAIIRKATRKDISHLIKYCTGKSIIFFLKSPYTLYHKSLNSTLRDGEHRHH
jgi:hypothetical protein